MDGDNAVAQRLEQVLDVTADLIAARTLAEVGRVFVERGTAALGAELGALWLVDAERQHLSLVDATALPTATPAAWALLPLELDAPLPAAVRTGQPIYIASHADYAARFPASYARVRDAMNAAERSYAMVPLVGDAAVLGAFAVTYARQDAVVPLERSYLRVLARECAVAIERIQLQERAQTARLDAAAATRGREEILAVVSHDLRNPLGTILMGASTLLHVAEPDDPRSARIRTVAERIQRQSERMARLIDDLVDFGALQAGRLAITRAPTPPLEVLTLAAEIVAPIAAERGVQLTIDNEPALPAIELDRERAVQVLANLGANALKVVTKHGSITIGATTAAAGEVVFSVRNTGAGVPPDELPRLFDDAWRGAATTYKGARMALVIARGLVALHGGRIWAENHDDGGGATISFTLAPPP